MNQPANRLSVEGRVVDETKAYTVAPMPPTAFGKYVLIGKLGHGGMAEVNLAVASGKGNFRKLAVIKRMHAHLEAEPGFVDMFLDEARLAAQLDHPHCVQTTEVGEANGQHFLAMEYLDGQGLERLLRITGSRNETLPPALVARMMADALDGLGYAHELTSYDGQRLGVVHRDVSPQNLFITYNGVVKLLDFGIAKAESNVTETKTGVVKGKYAYIAPEQALATPVDARADLWAMGVVMWEMLTSRRLFKSVNELATLQETLTGVIKRPSEVAPGIPPELDAIVMKALQREVEHRYQTAKEFEADLEHYLATLQDRPERRDVQKLMQDRFGDVIKVHRAKVAECLATIARDEQSIQRMVEGASLTSGEMGMLTPSHGGPSGRASGVSMPHPASQPVSVTPPPMTPTPYMTPSGVSIPSPQPISSMQMAGGPYPTPMPANPSNTYSAPPPTPYPSNPGFAPRPMTGSGAMAATYEPRSAATSLPPDQAQAPTPTPVASSPFGNAAPPREEKGRSLALWLVALGSVALLAVVALEVVPEMTADDGTVDEGSPGVGVVVVSGVGTPPVITDPVPVAVPDPTPTGPQEVVSDPRPDRRPRHRTDSTPATPSTAPVAPPPEPPPPSTAPSGGEGFLSLITSPWTRVSLNGHDLGETPLVRLALPAGHHTLRLTNPDANISETYEVDIRAGETTSRRLGLQ
jgi:serine/threonine protein kinase